MDEEKCEECKNKWSCKMLQGRFKVKECNPNRKFIVTIRHTMELINRENLLKELNK